MATALVNATVLLPAGFRDDMCVVIDGERIRAISSEAPFDADLVDLGGNMLLPGFIDTQVNGGGGVLFNDDPSVEAIAAIGAAHRRFGTTGFLPTLISDDLSVVERGIAAVDAAITAGVPGVIGIHIEGPYLSEVRHGIHDLSKLRPFNDDSIPLLCSLKRGRTVVTLAPERVEPRQIRALADCGVIVAAGHTDADYETAHNAIDHGLTGFTHLFNAMSPLASRAPGAVGAALEDDRAIAGIIVDGHHLHAAAVRVALRAKGADRLMLVTDAMPSVGSSEPDFMLQGRGIRQEGGMLRDADGVLAGSTLDMAGAVRNVMAQTGVSLRIASAMASGVPARFLGLAGETGAIAAGLRADLVVVDEDIQIVRSWIGGSDT